jgi:hypothetical protein
LCALIKAVCWYSTLGPALLACTMASAALILTFVIHRPQDSVFFGALLIGVVAYWWNRRS